ncbi:MAG: nucleotide-diphospho-sugar transferase [Treponema sp.]|nr:nucleotide-diphospho-sugar transferase [Treponema sp.]
MNHNKQLDVPVLFLTFNRLETTIQVFEQIKKQKPTQFFLASDGPRVDKIDEANVVHSVRKYLLDSIDWRCEVHTLFRSKNLGCGKAVSSAITWFFDNVEYGIILEDDCLPSDSFFKYAKELLLYYKKEPSVMHIGGYNPLDISLNGTDSYYFTKIHQCWGWASWRRSWKNFSYDITIEEYKNFIHSRKFKQVFPHIEERRYWKRVFREMTDQKINTWDYQWTFAILKNMGFCINPCRNLISNIGFSKDALHTTDIHNKNNNALRYEIFDINHPAEIILNKEFTDRISEEHFNIPINHLFRYYVRNIFKDIILFSMKRFVKFCINKFKDLKDKPLKNL